MMSHVFGSIWLKSNVKIICVNGSVQTKPVQSKTASLWIGPVRPSHYTGLDWALPRTGIVWTGGIIGSILTSGGWASTVVEEQLDHFLVPFPWGKAQWLPSILGRSRRADGLLEELLDYVLAHSWKMLHRGVTGPFTMSTLREWTVSFAV